MQPATSSGEHGAVSGGGVLVDALDEDSLEEVMARCSVKDLLSLGQTCKLFAELQAKSEKPWLSRLAADFGLHLTVKATPGNTLSQLAQLARNVYEEPVSAIRFQAVLVNGGVDDDNLQYWADNLFLPPPVPPSTKRRYYCSNCQRNADCLALLLHCEEIPREMNYELILRYARQRCRFAAAVLANIDDPQLHQMAGDAEWVNLVEQWSEQHLEQIFCFLALQLENGGAQGLWLLYDIPTHRRAEEQECIRAVTAHLRDRLVRMRAGMLKGENVWFDGSTVPEILDPRRRALVGVLRDLEICRAGSLTCPVAAGAVVAGVIDYSRLRGLSAAEMADLLQKAVRDPTCTALNSLETAASVEEAVAQGALPRIANRNATVPGQWLEFEHPAEGMQDGASTSAQEAPLISWTPLIWFRFHSKEEAQQMALLVHDEQPGRVQAPRAGLEPAEGPHDAAPFGGAGSGPEDPVNHPAGEQPPGQAMDEDEDDNELEGAGDFTGGRNLLLVPLLRPCAANVLVVKLINQESYLDDDDPHDFPNIDCNYVRTAGKLVRLPAGVALGNFTL